jgi:CheY-like chemotaxis protein
MIYAIAVPTPCARLVATSQRLPAHGLTPWNEMCIPAHPYGHNVRTPGIERGEGGTMRKVLVVDDEALIRGLVSIALEDEGYHVATAGDGLDALEKARSEQPDVIVLDLMMPHMNGWEFIHAIRADPALSQTPTIVVSAAHGGAEAEELGVQQFIAKPFDIDVLVAAVGNILSQPALS